MPDKKKKSAERKARVEAKSAKKSAQKEKKASKRPTKPGDDDNSSSSDEDDLDALLTKYAAAQQALTAVTTTALASPPAAVSAATFISNPCSSTPHRDELLLFGGESLEANKYARFHNTLHVYHTRKDAWSAVSSPTAPLPRSGHAWTRGGGGAQEGLFLFGGEFSSPKQGTFYHYGDLWRLDCASKEWTKVEARKGALAPPARSGHRMTFFKQYIVLFGGFVDTSAATKYLNDVWLYDCASNAWSNPQLPPGAQRPDPRSSCSLLPHEAGAVLYGGYSRVKSAAAASKSKGGASGGKGGQDVLKPCIHTDTWFLRITPPAPDSSRSGSASSAPPTIRWEKRKRPANAPNPPRCGATMAFHRGRGLLFGGVHDTEDSEEGIESEFFEQLFVWNIERNRFFPLAVKKPRANAAKGARGAGDGGRAGRSRIKDNEQELLRNLARLEAKGKEPGDASANSSDPSTANIEDIDSDSDSDEDAADQKPIIYTLPHARFNALLAAHGDTLYIYGGTFERQGRGERDREFHFDELWALHLGSLDGVREIFRREPEGWNDAADTAGSDDSDSDSDGDGDGDANDNADTSPAPEQDAPLTLERRQRAARADRAETLTTAIDDGAVAAMFARPSKTKKTRRQFDRFGALDSLPSTSAAVTATIATTTTANTTNNTTPTIPENSDPDSAPAAEDPEEAETEPDPSMQDPTLPFPRPFESLRAFFARTAVDWQTRALEQLRGGRAGVGGGRGSGSGSASVGGSGSGGGSADISALTSKDLRKIAFSAAEEQWWARREEVRTLEDEQEEAGIGEVVSLADKGAAGAGAGAGAGSGAAARRR